MTFVHVICPAAPEENDYVSADRADDLALDLSLDYGYAEIRLNDHLIGSYSDGGKDS